LNNTTGLSILLFLLILGFSKGLMAQSNSDNAYTVKPIWVEAKVLGILEQHDRLAVLQISRVDSSNEFHLSESSEILTEFVFGTKASDGDPKVPGVISGDNIRAEIHGKFNPSSGQWDYRVFRYFQIKQNGASKE
jgi:hypothetical protein